jgi:hypothetical protein
MKRVDDTEAKQAMLDALANYTGPITHCRDGEAMAKRTCKLCEFGECQNEFIPADKKKWTKFCCTEHRKRWHYLNRTRTTYREVEAVEDTEAQRGNQLNGHATNGHDVAKRKLTLTDLGLAPAQPTTQFKRRKLTNTQDAKQEERA